MHRLICQIGRRYWPDLGIAAGPARQQVFEFLFCFFHRLLFSNQLNHWIVTDHNWSDTASEKDGNSAPPTPGFVTVANQKAVHGLSQAPTDPFPGPHEYHEISDEEVTDSPGFDLGPSLMDEVLRALGAGGGTHSMHSPHHTDKHFDWKDETESKRGTLRDTLRKKQAAATHVNKFIDHEETT